MNSIVKSAIAGALALGGSSAFALGVPSTNSSDLILYVDAESSPGGSSVGVYALDTGISLSSLMPGGYVTGAKNNSKTFSITSQTIAASPTLTGFLNGHAGDTFEWALEGGQYNGAGTSAANSNSTTAGSALAIFTSKNLTPNAALGAAGATTGTAGSLENFLNGYQSDITNGGLTDLLTSKETAAGTELTSPPAKNKYTYFNVDDLGTAGGSSLVLFGLTGNGNGGTVQSYILGSISLAANGTLSITGNPTTGGGGGSPVPLPPAVWLFGSGLLGLVGVSRRRKTAAAV